MRWSAKPPRSWPRPPSDEGSAREPAAPASRSRLAVALLLVSMILIAVLTVEAWNARAPLSGRPRARPRRLRRPGRERLRPARGNRARALRLPPRLAGARAGRPPAGHRQRTRHARSRASRSPGGGSRPGVDRGLDGREHAAGDRPRGLQLCLAARPRCDERDRTRARGARARGRGAAGRGRRLACGHGARARPRALSPGVALGRDCRRAARRPAAHRLWARAQCRRRAGAGAGIRGARLGTSGLPRVLDGHSPAPAAAARGRRGAGFAGLAQGGRALRDDRLCLGLAARGFLLGRRSGASAPSSGISPRARRSIRGSRSSSFSAGRPGRGCRSSPRSFSSPPACSRSRSASSGARPSSTGSAPTLSPASPTSCGPRWRKSASSRRRCSSGGRARRRSTSARSRSSTRRPSASPISWRTSSSSRAPSAGGSR